MLKILFFFKFKKFILINYSFFRHQKLHESEEYQNFIGKVEEEEAWLNEKQQILSSPNFGENMAAVQGLLKKHDTLEVDLDVHQQRIDELIKQGKEVCFLILFCI